MGQFLAGFRSLFQHDDEGSGEPAEPTAAPAVPMEPVAPVPPTAGPTEPDIDALIAEAITIAEEHVEPGAQVHFGGSDSPVMGAADRLRQALELRPEDPYLHYALASALASAFQFATAREEMDRLVAAHPDFLPARFAVAGWEKWISLFELPSWTEATTSPDPFILGLVQRALLVATRDGLVPRATLFFRDAGGDLAPAAVREASIDLATVVSPYATVPQLVALYARVNDNPSDPYVIEQLGFPHAPRGERARTAYELLGTQEDLDIAVLSASGEVVHNRRVHIPPQMRDVHHRLTAALLESDGAEITRSQIMSAVPLHTSKFEVSQVPFEPAERVGRTAPSVVLV